jgi:hypothetical protein
MGTPRDNVALDIRSVHDESNLWKEEWEEEVG